MGLAFGIRVGLLPMLLWTLKKDLCAKRKIDNDPAPMPKTNRSKRRKLTHPKSASNDNRQRLIQPCLELMINILRTDTDPTYFIGDGSGPNPSPIYDPWLETDPAQIRLRFMIGDGSDPNPSPILLRNHPNKNLETDPTSNPSPILNGNHPNLNLETDPAQIRLQRTNWDGFGIDPSPFFLWGTIQT